MVLSDAKIIEEIEKGHVVITPFNQENLSTSSYDVTLGRYYLREQKTGSAVYNPYDKKDVERVWGTEPIEAEPLSTYSANIGRPLTNIHDDDKIILIDPGETILGHTEEFIGGRDHITTMMKARSSIGRNFLEVCKCAGWGDVGYTNRWTMEITNNSRNHSIPLVVGRRIAQIVFFETAPILGPDYTAKGKYQTTQDITQIQKDWDPLSIIPKMHNDRDIRH